MLSVQLENPAQLPSIPRADPPLAIGLRKPKSQGECWVLPALLFFPALFPAFGLSQSCSRRPRFQLLCLSYAGVRLWVDVFLCVEKGVRSCVGLFLFSWGVSFWRGVNLVGLALSDQGLSK